MSAILWNQHVSEVLQTPLEKRCHCTPGVCGELDEVKPGGPVLCDECGLVMVAATTAEIILRAKNDGAGAQLRTIPVIRIARWMPEVRRS